MPRRKHGNMPIELQIVTIRRILRSLNPDLDDVEVLPAPQGEDCEWKDYVEDDLALSENIGVLKEHFPQVQWSARANT